jgi:putative ABC transport system permease protein
VTGRRAVTGWRAALRVARREARRARGRSALVVAMIALPVALLGFAAVNYDSYTLTAHERADRLMGQAQAVVIWPYGGQVYQDPTEEVFFPAGASSQPAEPTRERVLSVLPPGTTAIRDLAGRLSVHTAAGVGVLDARMLDYADPLARGILRPLAGRAPQNAEEVALTPVAARRIGTGVGGTVRTADGTRAFHVVGMVEDPGDLSLATIVLRPGAVEPRTLGSDPRRQRWLVATPAPVTWAEVKQLNTRGLVAFSRYVLAHPPSQAERYDQLRVNRNGAAEQAATLLVAGMGLLEIVLLAGPAFAVGARRRQRDLALVAAAGGTPAQVRRIVLADGVVLGAVAAGVGVALGVAAAWAGGPLIQDHLAHSRPGGFRVFPVALAVLAGLSVVTGLLAALVPAWISSRQDVVAALAGRRGITRSRRRWPIAGTVLAGAGGGIAAFGVAGMGDFGPKGDVAGFMIIFAGLALLELGLVLATPAIVGLVARAGRWLPLAPRIALRDTSRNRTAAAPAISAVMAAVVGSIVVGVMIAAVNARESDGTRTLSLPGDVYLYDTGGGRGGPLSSQAPVSADAVAALRATLPVDKIHEIRLATCDGVDCFITPRLTAAFACPYAPWILQRMPTAAEQQAARHDPLCRGVGDLYCYFGGICSNNGMVIVLDPAAVGAVLHLPPEDAAAAAAALRDGAVVVDDLRYLVNGRVTINRETSSPDRSRGSQVMTARGWALPHRPRAPITVMTATTAGSLGLSANPLVVMATTTRLPTVDEEDRLQAAIGTRTGARVERPYRPDNPALVVLAIVAGVIALGAAAIATGLAAADGRAALGTLAAVGASPRIRRALSLSQAGVIAGLGSLLGVAAGLGAATAVLGALNQRIADAWPAPTPYPITVPWLNVGIALVVVPLVAMLGAGLLTRSRLPIERRL